MQYGMMLYRRGNHMITFFLRGKGHTLDRQVIAFGATIEDSIGFLIRAIIGQGDNHMAFQDNVVEIAIVLLTSDIDRPTIRRRQLIAIAQLSELSAPYIQEITKREITPIWSLYMYNS